MSAYFLSLLVFFMCFQNINTTENYFVIWKLQIWPFIHPADNEKFYEVIKQVYRTYGREDESCENPLACKELYIRPKFLEKHGIRWYMVIQEAGDVVVT